MIFKKYPYAAFFFWVINILLLSTHFANAQYNDTVIAVPAEDSIYNSSDEYNSDSDKHIYDSSEKFFSWKKYDKEPFLYDTLLRRSIPDSVIANMEKDDAFWYVKATEDFKKMYLRFQTDPAFRDSLMKAKGFKQQDKEVAVQEINPTPAWVNTAIWIIIIAVFLSAIIFFLSTNKISLFTKNDSTINDDGNNDKGDIFSINYPELIRKAVAEKNYRMAVRLHYLQTLRQLHEKTLITYQPENTNQHYLLQLQPTKYFSDFATVTRDYEYVWYGKFELNESGYMRVREDFLTLQNKVK